MNNTRRKILVFISLVILLCVPIYIMVIGYKEESALYAILLMWTPAFAAFITKLIFDKNLKGLGFKFGKIRYLSISYVIPIVACLFVYSIVWIIGVGGVDISKLTNGGKLSFVSSFAMGSLISMLLATGEEIGWRGFLVPELLKKFSYAKTSLIMGIIWNFYHYPLILFSDYNNGTSKLLSFIFFTIMVIAICFITTWMRQRSKSLWTGVAFHASHNMFVQGIFDQITVDYGKTKLITTEFGIGLAIAYTLMAFYFWKKSSKIL
jgi:membrane protease YdiL (CAAX protease family)